MIGKSSCASVAPSAQNRSKVCVDGPVRIAAGAIDLVDDEDRAQAQRERLPGDEARLRHRPLEGVDQQADAVDHPQHALDLAAEVGVARRVDDVDARPLPRDGGELGEDGDAALALEIVRVHRAVGDDLAGAELSRLPQEAVDERRLAVIDVRDDRDVADVLTNRPRRCQRRCVRGPGGGQGIRCFDGRCGSAHKGRERYLPGRPDARKGSARDPSPGYSQGVTCAFCRSRNGSPIYYTYSHRYRSHGYRSLGIPSADRVTENLNFLPRDLLFPQVAHCPASARKRVLF